ncbi:DUF2922 domain-containing protein [Clostridium polynesiense]|uniref:DUF2922 domain-containing protein n=1 Tax=Clostridium polynesiense TaxID=1325933 RepID=UPI00058FC221|nr:DUF2922 domain-containing protein [Clostridium polynesiense]
MENKVLVMTFKNQQGKKINIRLGNIKPNLTDAQVMEAMNAVVAGNILLTNGGDVVSKEEAEMITTNTSPFTIQ